MEASDTKLEIPAVHAVIRLVLVDDDPCVLRGLSRSLALVDPSLEVMHCGSADECIALLDTMNADAVVTDLHMPQRHGASLLEELRDRHPSILRFVLSGEANPSIFLPASSLALRCFIKPCDAAKLHETVVGALADLRCIRLPEVAHYITRLSNLPSSRRAMREIATSLQDPNLDLVGAGEVLQRDPSMVARILKAANSAFFGMESAVDTLDGAVSILGLDTVLAMVATHQVFSAMPPPTASRLQIEALWEHSIRVSSLARHLGPRLHLGSATVREATTACLLHDLGKLVLACAAPSQFGAAMIRSAADYLPLWQCEYPIFKNHHAEVGACLLHLWGFPEVVINAVGHHHAPHRSGEGRPGPATLVHLADGLVHARSGTGEPVLLDRVHLRNLSLPETLEELLALVPAD